MLDLSGLWKMLNNQYVSSFLAVFLGVYAALVGPKLSPEALSVLQSDGFRLVAIFLIAYMPEKNFQFALVLSVVLVLTLNFVNEQKLLESFMYRSTNRSS